MNDERIRLGESYTFLIELQSKDSSNIREKKKQWQKSERQKKKIILFASFTSVKTNLWHIINKCDPNGDADQINAEN